MRFKAEIRDLLYPPLVITGPVNKYFILRLNDKILKYFIYQILSIYYAINSQERANRNILI